MDDDLITSRAVFFVGGYDPKTPEQFFAKLAVELRRFVELWRIDATVSPVRPSADGDVGIARLDTLVHGRNIITQFHFIVLDKLVLHDFGRPLPVRLAKYLIAFLDFVVSGVMIRLFCHGWRFALYFLYPFVVVALFAAVAAIAGLIAARLSPAVPAAAGWTVGILVFAGLQAWLGARWPINHLMDLWSFSRNFLRGRRPDAESLMQKVAESIVAAVTAERFDEIILVGHSTGGALILDLAARCLQNDPRFCDRARHTVILTLGSTALKIGMHPAARKFRKGVQTLVDEERLDWIEVQCLTDVINLYRTDPVALMGLKSRPSVPFPLVKLVRMKDMLQPAIYKRIRRNFFRVHYQYIFGNTKPYFYDFFMICCGPISLRTRMEKQVVGPELAPETMG